MKHINTNHLQLDIDFDRGVATLTLDRTDKLNAITNTMLEGIADAVETCRRYDEEDNGVAIRAVVIQGAGDQAFSTGYDITEFNTKKYPAEERAWQAATGAIESYGAPFIAKIDGYCLGGALELSLACDFRFASERSELGFPEIEVGLFPSGGGTQRLEYLVGPTRTKELCMTGTHFDAKTAQEDGILTDSVPAEALDERVATLVNELAAKPPLAVRATKDVVNTTQEMPPTEGRSYELSTYQPLLNTEDHAEGVAAFEENREPEWVGR